MEKYEYKYVDLNLAKSISPQKKNDELIKKLNEIGEDGWLLVSGIGFSKPFVFVRKITE